MSSINPHFTFTYSQPEEYRFSHDSVFLARRVFEDLRGEDLSNWRVLDLCAGCGIVGLDFLFHLRTAGQKLPAADFLEIQEAYAEHFHMNASRIPEAKTRFLARNYSSLASAPGRYDLILCNPPYFREGQGATSPSEFKNRCRFLMDSDFPTLIRAILASLAPRGQAYLLLRELRAHGIDTVAELRSLVGNERQIKIEKDVRGTGVIRLVPRP